MINQKALNLIKLFEGLYLTAYKCPAGVWTIGYGHTGKDVYSGKRITEKEAEELLMDDLKVAEKQVAKYDSIYNWNENEYGALVSFAFNIGSIDQLTAKGTRGRDVIRKKMLEYNKAAGKVLAGLIRRREAELSLFNENVCVKSDVPNYQLGCTYTLKCNLNVRVSPRINAAIVTHENLTANAKLHDKDKNGSLEKGTRITVRSKECDHEGNLWLKIPSGWICAYNINKDAVYVR